MNEQELRKFLRQYIGILGEEEINEKLYDMFNRCKLSIRAERKGNLSEKMVLDIFEEVRQGFKKYVKEKENNKSFTDRMKVSNFGGRPMASCNSTSCGSSKTYKDSCSSGRNYTRSSCGSTVDYSRNDYSNRSYSSSCGGSGYGRGC